MPTAAKKPRILIVEDENIVALDIQAQLQKLGYQPIGHVARGLDAIAVAKAQQPDLILMDIQLAGEMDGITAAQIIRAECDLPVVFITAYDADEILARAKLTEPYGYILKPFSERELHNVIEMALYKHQAETKLRQSMEQLQSLSRRVLEVQESERRRVAIELHDELGQSLTAIKINLQAYELFKKQTPAELNAENIRIVEDALQQVRRISLALRPSMLDDLGLGPALQWLAEQTATRCGISIHFERESRQIRLAPDIETACFRIVQEALTNIARHAKAQHVEISVQRENGFFILCINDDGIGFDSFQMQECAAQGASIGVLGMQERAMLIGGHLELTSRPEQGCRIRMQCPLRTVEPA
jgi:signal transduction histidine kinase